MRKQIKTDYRDSILEILASGLDSEKDLDNLKDVGSKRGADYALGIGVFRSAARGQYYGGLVGLTMGILFASEPDLIPKVCKSVQFMSEVGLLYSAVSHLLSHFDYLGSNVDWYNSLEE